jgi:hypothetical protein
VSNPTHSSLYKAPILARMLELFDVQLDGGSSSDGEPPKLTKRSKTYDSRYSGINKGT